MKRTRNALSNQNARNRTEERVTSKLEHPFRKRTYLGVQKGSRPDPNEIGGVKMERIPFIFLSYGHDAYSVLARKLKTDLESQGYEVWYDFERLIEGKDWAQYIEEGLEKARRLEDQGHLIFLMTHHSVRRPDGFCLNELAKACAEGIRSIIPVLVQCGSKPPLSICRLQYLDIHDCLDNTLTLHPERYTRYLNRILEVLRRERTLESEGGEATLRQLLPPIDFAADRFGHKEFSGREWLFEQIQGWLEAETPRRVLWIKGKAGVGKTGLAIKICDQYEQVVAHHLCKAENQEKKKPENLVKSIAYQLSTQIPEYRDKLLDPSSRLEHTLSEYKDDPRTLFEKLVVEPLYGIPREPGVKKVIVIDAVDEANNAYSNDITAFIRDEFWKTPPWLRLILTSRDDPLVNSDLTEYRSEAITIESQDNDNDILHYLEKHLKQIVPDGEKANAYAKEIAKKSQGMFLYAVEVMKSIRLGDLKLDKLDEFPIGMNAFYKRNYERQFPPSRPEEIRDYEERVLPLLNIIAAAMEPLDRETLISVLNLSTQKEADRLFQKMGTLFIRTDGKLIPVHKSLMDWLVSEAAGIYKIYPLDGHGLLAENGWKRLKEEEERGWEDPFDYAIKNVGIHLYASKERPEKDATVRNRLVELFKKSFAGKRKERPLKKVIDALLTYVIAHHKESEETGFKGIVGRFLKAEAQPEAKHALAAFLHNRYVYDSKHGNAEWARWMLQRQHSVLEELVGAYPENTGWKRDLSISWSKVGDIEKARGNLSQAQDAYEKAQTIRLELTEKDPTNTKWQRDLGVSWNKIGDIEAARGNLSQARDAYEKTLTIFLELTAKEPTNTKWQRDLGVSWSQFGDIEKARGNLSQARVAYEKALAIRLELTEKDPTNTKWQRDLGVSWSKVGDIEKARGNPSQAQEAYEKGLTIRLELSKIDPTNTDWQRDLGVSWGKIGDIKAKRGNLDQAWDAYEKALAIRLELKEKDPANTKWQRDLGVTWSKVGDNKEARGNPSQAQEAYEKGLTIRLELTKIDPTNTDWQRDLGVSWSKIGYFEAKRGNLDQARDAYEKALAIRLKLSKIDPTNTDWLRDLSVSWYRIGDIEAAQGNLSQAQDAYEKELAIILKLTEKDPTNTKWQRSYRISLSRLGILHEQRGDSIRAKEYLLKVLELRLSLVNRAPQEIDFNIGLVYALLDLYSVVENEEEKRKYWGEASGITKSLVEAGVKHNELEDLKEILGLSEANTKRSE